MSKKASTEVYELVQSLTKAEKRHFKLYAARHASGDDKKYLRLFDAMESQSEYNEEQLVLKEPGLKSSHFSSLKKYLYEMILRSLRDYHHTHSPFAQMRFDQDCVDILYHKGLYKHCSKILARTKKTASTHEYHLSLLDVLVRQRAFVSRVTPRDYIQRKESFHKEMVECVQKIQNTLEYELLADQAYYMMSTDGGVHNPVDSPSLDKLIRHDLLTHESKALSFIAKFLFFDVRRRYAYTTGNFDECSYFSKRTVELFHSYPEISDGRTYEYLHSCHNYALDRLSKRDFATFRAYSDIIVQLGKEHKEFETQVYECLVFQSLWYNIISTRFKEGVEYIASHEERIFRDKDKYESGILMAIMYTAGYVCCIAGNYSRALFWINHMQEQYKIEQRGYLDNFSQIMAIICHYELGHAEYVDSLILSTYRRLLRKRRLFKFEEMLLKFLKKLSKITTQRSLLSEFEALRNEFRAHADDPFMQQTLQFFDVDAWLTSKIECKSFAETLREKAALYEAATVEENCPN